MRAVPLADALGISRVTDITRMDRLGLPVFASIRPRGQTLRVHAGKGLLALDARVGALMEAIEYAAAEPQRSRWRSRTMRAAELEAAWPDALRLVDFAPRIGLRIRPDQMIEAVACDDLAGTLTWLPAELVFVPFESRCGPRVYGWSTSGLASGNSVDEATLHALLEVLERDAVAMNLPRDESLWVGHASLPEPFEQLARDWRKIGVELAVRFVPNVFGLPCFTARLYQGGGATVDLAEGAGIHVERGIALARAVCEAAQSRLSHIHGGRDDITTFYARRARAERAPSGDACNPLIESTFDEHRRVFFQDIPDESCDGDRPLSELLHELLARLRQAGFPRVFRHRFAVDLDGLHVVKVIVPRCEDVEDRPTRMGLRLFARVMADA